MGKNTDLAIILSIVLLGMLIPFIGSLVLTFGIDISCICGWKRILSAFGYFILIFGIELVLVLLYFSISNKYYKKKLDKFNKK